MERRNKEIADRIVLRQGSETTPPLSFIILITLKTL